MFYNFSILSFFLSTLCTGCLGTRKNAQNKQPEPPLIAGISREEALKVSGSDENVFLVRLKSDKMKISDADIMKGESTDFETYYYVNSVGIGGSKFVTLVSKTQDGKEEKAIYTPKPDAVGVWESMSKIEVEAAQELERLHIPNLKLEYIELIRGGKLVENAYMGTAFRALNEPYERWVYESKGTGYLPQQEGFNFLKKGADRGDLNMWVDLLLPLVADYTLLSKYFTNYHSDAQNLAFDSVDFIQGGTSHRKFDQVSLGDNILFYPRFLGFDFVTKYQASAKGGPFELRSKICSQPASLTIVDRSLDSVIALQTKYDKSSHKEIFDLCEKEQGAKKDSFESLKEYMDGGYCEKIIQKLEFDPKAQMQKIINLIVTKLKPLESIKLEDFSGESRILDALDGLLMIIEEYVEKEKNMDAMDAKGFLNYLYKTLKDKESAIKGEYKKCMDIEKESKQQEGTKVYTNFMALFDDENIKKEIECFFIKMDLLFKANEEQTKQMKEKQQLVLIFNKNRLNLDEERGLEEALLNQLENRYKKITNDFENKRRGVNSIFYRMTLLKDLFTFSFEKMSCCYSDPKVDQSDRVARYFKRQVILKKLLQRTYLRYKISGHVFETIEKVALLKHNLVIPKKAEIIKALDKRVNEMELVKKLDKIF